MSWAVVAVVAAGLLIAAWLARARLLRRFSGWQATAAIEVVQRQFANQRDQLQRAFLERASATGKPKGLKWERIDLEPEATFVRDRQTGEPTAFVEATIAFSAIEGGGMEHVQAVGNLRHATAVFHFHAGNWGTGGRALFNMTPAEAAAHLSAQYEPLG